MDGCLLEPFSDARAIEVADEICVLRGGTRDGALSITQPDL